MTTTTNSLLFDTGKTSLDLARRQTLSLIEDIPADKMTFQPVPKTNHVLWVLGHNAVTDDYFRKTFAGGDAIVDESWSGLFGMGSEPVDDPSKYPSADELKSAMEATRAKLIDAFAEMDEQKLLSALPEDWSSFAPTHATLMGAIAWHEGLHAGQLSAIRRALNIAPSMG